jgi:hypothetical protein
MTAATYELRDERFRRNVERLHRLGPRVLTELLMEIAGERLIRSEIEQRVATYARLDPMALEAVGADRVVPPPLHLARPR